MKKEWPRVTFGQIMRPNKRPYMLGETEDANLVGMRLYGGGPFHRELKPALQIAKKSHFVIKSGDVIYNKLFAWKGTFGIVPPELDGMFVSDKFPTYELDRTRVDEGWLRWYFRYSPLWEEAQSISIGSAALSKLTLNPPKFLLLTVPLPPLAEQRRVVARLEELALQIREARMLRHTASDEAGALLQNSIASIIGVDWPLIPLEQVVDPERPITYGIVQAGVHVADGVPYIRVSDMARPQLTTVGMLRTAPEIAARYRRSAVREGDIVFAIRATVGKMRFVPKELDGANLTQGTARIAPSDKATAPYLFWALQRRDVLESIQAATKGSTFKEITLGRLREIQIPLPPLNEQRQIVEQLNSLRREVDALKGLQSETAAELDQMIPAALHRAFNGGL